ncbi:MAG: hypothetical protein HY713_00100 [candidate division NC10 bacterium]|nr:hypothetical protein [candidate division NC10 bacterium]
MRESSTHTTAHHMAPRSPTTTNGPPPFTPRHLPTQAHRLHAAPCQSLDWGKPSTAEAMAKDGEGYEVIVQLDSEPWDLAHPWGHRALPYTSPDLQQYSPEPLRPWEEWHTRD